MASGSTSFRLDSDLLKAVKRACIDRNTNMTQAVEAGLRLWLHGTGEDSGPRAAEVTGEGMPREVERALELYAHPSVPPKLKGYLIREVMDWADVAEGTVRKAAQTP